MSGGSGNDNLLNMGLMIAAGIAAPALAPMLMTGGAAGLGLGATAATAATGATLGGIAGAVTGKDPLQSALMGGLGGAASGYFGGVNPAEAGSMLAATPSVPVEADPTSLLSAGSNVPNTATAFTSPLPDVANVSKSAAQLPVQQQLFGFPKAQTIGGGIAGINEILSAKPTSAYIPPDSKYKGGSLANFKYDPNRYTPADVPPLPYSYREMAMGGLAMGGMPPRTNFANPSQSMMGTSQYSMATDPMSGNIANRMAGGGLASISNFAGGGVTGGGEMQLTVPINIGGEGGSGPYTPAGGGFGGGGGYAPPGGPQGGSMGSLASLLKGAQQGQSPAGAPQAQGAQGAQMNMQENSQMAKGMSADVNGFTPIQTNQGTLLAGQFLQGLSGLPDQQESSNAMGSMQQKIQAADARAANRYMGPEYANPIGMARGGIASLGMYSDGGRLLRGPGDGVSDNIPARIGQRQEARLADGEFVVPARIVSELGNGSTEAGAKRLYKMMDNVQSSRKKSIGKGKFAQNTKAYKHLPA
jgi:hypothetical protein